MARRCARRYGTPSRVAQPHQLNRRKQMRIFGLILIVAGAVALVYGGITYTKRRDTVHLGPFSATVRQKETVPIPPILGGIALAAGVVLVIAGGRKRNE